MENYMVIIVRNRSYLTKHLFSALKSSPGIYKPFSFPLFQYIWMFCILLMNKTRFDCRASKTMLLKT